MVYLISGASHTGKTKLSQRLLEEYKISYLSIDHLKMGLIRSGNTNLTVYDDLKLTDFLWKIIKEIIMTAIENNQNLIIEGCYIPFDFKKDFDAFLLQNIKYLCLIMSEKYIDNNFEKIIKYANVIENRISDSLSIVDLKKDNNYYYENCKKYNLNYYYIDNKYDINIKSLFSE